MITGITHETKIPRHSSTVGQVSIGIDLYMSTNAGFRGVSTFFKVIEPQANVKSISYSCIRQWVFRLGFGLLNQKVAKRKDWIYIIDFSIQLGEERCLLILGTTQEALKNGFALQHSQVQALDIYVQKKFSGDLVSQRLLQVSRRTGTPVQIVSDKGSDINRGVNLYCAEHSSAIHTYDISHKIGVLLKRYLERDKRWLSLHADLVLLQQQVKQTNVSFLGPATTTSKGRWLNIGKIIDWLAKIYSYQEKGDYSLIEEGWKIGNKEVVFKSLKASCKNKHETKRLIKAIEQTIFRDREELNAWLQGKRKYSKKKIELKDAGLLRFNEKFSVLEFHREYFKELDQLNKMLTVIKNIIKTKGLSSITLQQIEVEHNKLTYPWVKQVYGDLFSYLKFELSQSKTGDFPLLCCSDIIESVFGKFKVRAKQSIGGIYGSVLLIALTCGKLSYSKIKEILSKTSMQEANQWFYSMVGASNLAKRRKAFNST